MNATTRSRRISRRNARGILAVAGSGALLALAGGAPALAVPGDHALPDVELVIPTGPPVPPVHPTPPFEPELPEGVPTDDPTDEPTDDPTEPADIPDGPGDITSCEDALGEDVCHHPDPEPTPEPVDPCEPGDPAEGIDDLTAVVPMAGGGELHLTAEVADCTPTTGGGGGAPFTG